MNIEFKNIFEVSTQILLYKYLTLIINNTYDMPNKLNKLLWNKKGKSKTFCFRIVYAGEQKKAASK